MMLKTKKCDTKHAWRHLTRLSMAALMLLLGLPLAWGCSLDEFFSDATTTTKLSIELNTKLSPAPSGTEPTDGAGVQGGAITISGIYLQGGPADDKEDGHLWLTQTSRTVDLISLADEVAIMVSDTPVTRGEYGQLRFVVSGGYIQVLQADGTSKVYATTPTYEGLPAGTTVTGDLRMPSGSSSGFKVKLPGDALDIDGEQKIVRVEFDVRQSFGHEAGKSGAWVMHPVMTATDVIFTSTVEVQVSLAPDLVLPSVDGVPATLDTFEVTLTDADGSARNQQLANIDDDPAAFEAEFEFTSPLLNPYEIVVRSLVGLTITTEPASPYVVEVPSGEIVVYAFTITNVAGGDPVSAETGALEVRLHLNTTASLPPGITLGSFSCGLARDDQEPATSGFVDVSGTFTAVFSDLDPSNPWRLDLNLPQGIAVTTTPALPVEAALAPGETIVVDITLNSVTLTP